MTSEPQAIILKIDDYIDTFAPTPAWLKAIGAEAKRKGLDKLTMRQIDAEIAAARRERRKTPVTRPAKMIRVVLTTALSLPTSTNTAIHFVY